MVCLTPKNRDMTIVRGLYGGFVPCKVVSMKEVSGKKSLGYLRNLTDP